MSYHYGISPKDFQNMPIDLLSDYIKSIEIIKAEESLNLIELMTYPHLKNDEDRTKIRKKYEKIRTQGMKRGLNIKKNSELLGIVNHGR